MDLPKNRIPKALTEGLFRPEYIPVERNVNDFIQVVELEDEEQTREKLVQEIASTIDSPLKRSVGGIPVPLSEAEAEEADRQMARVLQRIVATRDKINSVRAQIDEEIKSELGGKELSFQIDISRKPRIRRAIKKLFGIKADTITYTMYKAMLEAKVQLEKEEVADYAKGKTKPDKQKEKKDKDKKSDDKGGGKRGFLKSSSNQEEGDEQADLEEQYEKLHPKIGRDFLAIDDAKELVRQMMLTVDPLGLSPIELDDSNARAKAQEYKDVVETGKDNKNYRKRDLVKIDAAEEEEE